MENNFKTSIKNIVWALRKIVNITYQDSRSMVKKHGITGPQAIVLNTIYNSANPLSSADISRLINVTPSNITGIIDRLEEKELVKRTKKQGDRRTMFIELTNKGQEFSKTLPDLIEEKLMKGLYNLSSTEIYGIYCALEQIIEVIKEEDKGISSKTDLIDYN